MQLNPNQQELADHFEGPCFVLAGPGSGKTASITERIVRLIERGVNPANILCLTFTNKAADEMKQRICGRLNVPKVASYIGTFHALCVRILKKWGSRIGYGPNLTILDTNDQKDLMTKVVRNLGKDPRRDKIRIPYILHQLDDSRELNETPEQLAARFKDAFEGRAAFEYLDELKANNCVDFSGLLYDAIKVLEQETDVREALQRHFKYIQVDEVQDTNLAQFILVELIGGAHENMVLIGDTDQSIYKFRGARYENITDFMAKHKCKVISLGKNYRSTPQIIASADKLIKNNSTHPNIVFETDNPSGDDVEVLSFSDSSEEARWVAQRCQNLVDEGWSFKDIAVFYRMNKLSLELQTAMSRYGIPHTVIGGQSFFDRKEIRDCISLMRVAANPKDAVAFHRAAALFSGVGSTTIGNIEKLARENNTDLIEACRRINEFTDKSSLIKAAEKINKVFGNDWRGMDAGDILAHVTQKMDYMAMLQIRDEQDWQDRWQNVQELIVNATDSALDITDYLQRISLVATSDKSADGDSVSLMTIHASKGLEFPIVIIVGVEKSILPHDMALNEASTVEERQAATDEERRILYVGMTRSETKLSMSYCRIRKLRNKNGDIDFKATGPSQFLKDAGLLSEDDYVKARMMY